MQINYLDVLYSKFIRAKGYNKIDTNSIYMNDEFEEWLGQCAMQLNEYRRYLDYRRIRYNEKNIAEIGHGSLDTVIPKNGKSLIVTPYSNSFENKSENRILQGYFQCNALGIDVYSKNPKSMPVENNLKADLSNYSAFITQNPNDLRILEDMSKAHIMGKNILVCFYGNNCDADREFKMNVLKDLRQQLFTDYKQEEIHVKNSFVNLIYTDTLKEEDEQKQYKKTF